MKKLFYYTGVLVSVVVSLSLLLFVLSNLLFVVLALISVMAAPFTGFTFTDALDFGPCAFIAAALIALAARHIARPWPKRWMRFAYGTAYVLAVLPPLAYFAVLYSAAWCAMQGMGHWPKPMIDDPNLILSHNTAYQATHRIVDYAEAFVGAGVWVWAALLLHLRRRLLCACGAVLLGSFLLSWTLFACSGLFQWWID